MMEREYIVVYEPIRNGGWSAYVPDLPGLAAAADSSEETETLIREGIEIYLGELLAMGEPIPQPTSHASRIKISA